MQGVQQCVVGLQQRLAAGQHDKSVIATGSPFVLDRACEVARGLVRAAARPIGADEVGIAEAALRGPPIVLSLIHI